MSILHIFTDIVTSSCALYTFSIYCRAYASAPNPNRVQVLLFRAAAYALNLANLVLVRHVALKALIAIGWLILASCCYRFTFLQRVYLSLIIYILMCATETVTGVITVTVLGVDIRSIGNMEAVYSLNLFTDQLIAFLFVKLILFLTKKETRRLDSGFSAAMLGVFVLVIFYMIFLHAVLAEPYSTEKNILVLVAVSLLGIAVIAVFFLNERQTRLAEYRTRLREMEHQYELQVQTYQNLRDNARAVGKNLHDVKNFALAVDSYLGQGKVDEARRRLREYTQGIQAAAGRTTGSLTVDALLAAKEREIDELHAQKHLSVVLGESLPIDEIDLCILLGNALDNAIEESRRIADPADRRIELRVLPWAGGLSIFVQNKMAASKEAKDARADMPEPKHGRDVGAAKLKYGSGTGARVKSDMVRSWKDDPFSHGFGIGNMRAICEKYGSSLEIAERSGCFELSVFLPGGLMEDEL